MLAQRWLYGNRVRTRYDHYLERRLLIPGVFNEHSSVAVLNNIAERIVFTDDVPSLLYELYENKQLTYKGMISTTHLPFDCFWIEYPSKVGLGDLADEVIVANYGALIHRIGHTGAIRMFIVTGLLMKDDPPDVQECSITHVLEFPQWPPTIEAQGPKRFGMQFDVAYAFNNKQLTQGSRDAEELGAIVCEIIFGIFLVTHPRVYSVEDVQFKPSHKAARARKGKPPLMEYRKIRVHIGKGKKQYAQRPATASLTHADNTDDDASIQHRRYHKVMGHFRHYTKNNPRSVWIDAHYRGDPSIGVTFTERDVSR